MPSPPGISSLAGGEGRDPLVGEEDRDARERQQDDDSGGGADGGEDRVPEAPWRSLAAAPPASIVIGFLVWCQCLRYRGGLDLSGGTRRPLVRASDRRVAGVTWW